VTAVLPLPSSRPVAEVAPRGPLSRALFDALACPPGSEVIRARPPTPGPGHDPLADEDLQLALYCCYELHYRGLEGVDDGWEWDPGLLAFRASLEDVFEQALRDAVGPLHPTGDVAGWLQGLLTGDGGPSTSAYCAEHATLEQVREEVVHRSLYQLKEADPHSWVLPRLHGRPKAALVEIQADEYGDGVQRDMHAELFALTMERLGVDPTYNAHLDLVPAPTLATVNLISMFGLHRRLRGAAVGHLALFEMASVPVMANHDAGLRRLGFDDWTRLFYTTHVVADAHHQTVAAHELAGGLVEQDPTLEVDVMFGARALALLESRATDHVLGAWHRGEPSLRRRLDPPTSLPGRTEDRAPAEDPRRG
jgi:hypothetical protein